MDALPATCEVALPIPSPTPYTYTIPPSLADRVVPGARVVVPVRGRDNVGIVVALDDTGPAERALKSVLLAPDPTPLVSSPLIELAHWMARYYAAPIGPTIKAMLPAALWGTSSVRVRLADGSRAGGGVGRAVTDQLGGRRNGMTARQLARVLRRPVWDVLQRLDRAGAVELTVVPPSLGPAPAVERVIRLNRELPSLMERDKVFGRAARQREAFRTLDELGGEMAVSRVVHEFGFSHAVLKGLVERGVALIEDVPSVRDPFSDQATPAPTTATDAQGRAIDTIAGLPPGGAALLHGVTGSGKTLVYLRALQPIVESGRGAIVLVPEIALTPQTVARVRGVFGDRVAVLHSGLSDGERADAWRELGSGRRQVAVGARSALFAPVQRLGAIVLDEEHDASYKNGETPRYHARDVARKRARIEGAVVVYGTATPSLDLWFTATTTPRVEIIRLPERVGARPLPPVRLVDLRTAGRVTEAAPVPWSLELDEAVQDRLVRREQVILLLNRRGFAHYMLCNDCGVAIECPSCALALTVHRTPAGLRCHYCGHERAIPTACPTCGGVTHHTRGVGTQSVERWLSHRFPDARLARMDADTTSTKWSHARILDAFADGQIDILFGTQMIAKGLDFPQVTLVGVINADTGLHLPDFRAAERTFQLIAQVAGRAGRGPAGGTVLVQSHAVDHYALQAAAQHDFDAFAERELEIRRAPAYPPHVGLVNVVVSGDEENDVSRAADEWAGWFRGLVETHELPVEVVGPAPAPLTRIKKRWRWHFLLRSFDPPTVGRVVRYGVARRPPKGQRAVRVSFDRDPVSLL